MGTYEKFNNLITVSINRTEQFILTNILYLKASLAFIVGHEILCSCMTACGMTGSEQNTTKNHNKKENK